KREEQPDSHRQREKRIVKSRQRQQRRHEDDPTRAARPFRLPRRQMNRPFDPDLEGRSSGFEVGVFRVYGMHRSVVQESSVPSEVDTNQLITDFGMFLPLQ